METKNVLVVVGVAVVLSVIVSLAVVGNLKGTGYAVGDTTKVRVAEGKNGTFSLGGVKHTISVSFADAKTGRVNFSIDNTLTKSTSVGGSVNYVGVESIYGQNFEATVDKITSFFGRDYVYFTVKEIPVNASQPVSSEELIPGRVVFSSCNWTSFSNIGYYTPDEIGSALAKENFKNPKTRTSEGVIVGEVDLGLTCCKVGINGKLDCKDFSSTEYTWNLDSDISCKNLGYDQCVREDIVVNFGYTI